VDPTDNPSAPASPPGRATFTPRLVGWLALGGVSVIAGIASYFHAFAVVQAAGATFPVSYLVPALADLVILGASADLLTASRAGDKRPHLTMVALAVGIVVTLAMNVAAADPHEVPKWLVNGWPALAFTLALESLAGLVRRGRGGGAQAAPAVSAITVGCGHGVAETRDERLLDAYTHLRDCLGADPSYRGIGAAFGVHHDTVRQLVMAADGEASAPVPSPIREAGSAVAAGPIWNGPGPSLNGGAGA
jgi:hypothetical protein